MTALATVVAMFVYGLLASALAQHLLHWTGNRSLLVFGLPNALIAGACLTMNAKRVAKALGYKLD